MIEELLAGLLYQSLDPDEKVSRYIEVTLDLLRRVREELERGDIGQAAEKLWGVAALAIKAYAL